jgi:hypothetical protein
MNSTTKMHITKSLFHPSQENALGHQRNWFITPVFIQIAPLPHWTARDLCINVKAYHSFGSDDTYSSSKCTESRLEMLVDIRGNYYAAKHKCVQQNFLELYSILCIKFFYTQEWMKELDELFSCSEVARNASTAWFILSTPLLPALWHVHLVEVGSLPALLLLVYLASATPCGGRLIACSATPSWGLQ